MLLRSPASRRNSNSFPRMLSWRPAPFTHAPTLVSMFTSRFRVIRVFRGYQLPLLRQMRVRLQPFPDELVEFLARRLMLDALDDFAGKGVNQHPPRRLRTDAAGAEVKNGFLVQLPDRRAVGALHVVGVNLELRLGVRGGVVGKQKILIGLFRVGFLRDLLHEDAAVEDALGFVVEDAVEVFVAGAMRLGVLDNHVVIGQLLAAREIEPVENALQTLTRELGADEGLE